MCNRLTSSSDVYTRLSRTPQPTSWGWGDQAKLYEPSLRMTIRDAIQRPRHPIMSRPSGGSSTRATPAWANPPDPGGRFAKHKSGGGEVRLPLRHLVPHDLINPAPGEGGGDRDASDQLSPPAWVRGVVELGAIWMPGSTCPVQHKVFCDVRVVLICSSRNEYQDVSGTIPYFTRP